MEEVGVIHFKGVKMFNLKYRCEFYLNEIKSWKELEKTIERNRKLFKSFQGLKEIVEMAEMP